MAQESEDMKVDGTSEPETWSQAESDCSDDVRDFWDTVIDGRIDRIGRAPPPQRYSRATTSSIEALDEAKQILEDAMKVIQHRCDDEELALQGILDALREHLECERHAIARSIATIHNHRNLLVPVMRLPPEILSQIFVFHARMEGSWLDAALTSTHVCKRWWKIGRACPELWSHIKYEDCHSAAWMARMIRRSRTVPLSLVISGHSEMSTQEMTLIVNNMHRFESLDLRVPREGDQSGPFFEAFGQPVPLLQRLSIRNHGYSMFAFPPEFLGGSAPNLRHMTLSTRCDVPWDSALFGHLTTLDVSGPERGYHHPDAPSLGMLLSALTRMPGLEILILRHCLPPLAPSMEVHPHVDLSNLKRLEVAGRLTCCTCFLRQITTNARAIVIFELMCSHVSREDIEEFFTFFPSHLCTTSLPTAQALKFTWGYRDFKIDMWTVQQDTKDKRSENATIKLGFKWGSDRFEMSPLDLTWACFAALASPQLQSFRISNGHSVGWDVEVWRKLARVAPNLQTLAPGREGQSVELCKTLSPPDGSDLAPADCCLPALSYLELDISKGELIPAADGEESPVVVLARSLARRALIGCSTPLLMFGLSWRNYPEGWWKPLEEAIPGIRMRAKRQAGEGYMVRAAITYFFQPY